MASYAGATLIWRGTFLDRLWALNAQAYKRLVPLGSTAGMGFLVLAAALAIAGAGWFRRRFWGWGLAAAIIAAQVLANMVNAIRGDFLSGGVGLVFAGALLYFLLRPQVRAAFPKRTSPSEY